MTFRRSQKTVKTAIVVCGIEGLFTLIVLINPGEALWPAFLIGMLVFLVLLVAFVLLFYLAGFMDIIQMDEKGITITLLRLFRRKHTEYASWENVKAIKAIKGYGGWVLLIAMGTTGKYNYHISESLISLGWNKKLEEYLCVNHPEIPFTPVKYGKK